MFCISVYKCGTNTTREACDLFHETALSPYFIQSKKVLFDAIYNERQYSHKQTGFFIDIILSFQQNLVPQTAFDSAPGYQIPQRNDYSSQPRNDYPNEYSNQGPGGSHSYGRTQGANASGGPHGHGVSQGQSGPHHQGSMDTMGRPSPWASSNNSSHWSPNPPIAAQVPQSSFAFNSQQSNLNTYGQQVSILNKYLVLML